MTPQESVTAYEAWCAVNKSFKITWTEGTQGKTLIVHMKETVAAKMIEILPASSETMSIVISKVVSTPSFDGYKEWLQYQ